MAYSTHGHEGGVARRMYALNIYTKVVNPTCTETGYK